MTNRYLTALVISSVILLASPALAKRRARARKHYPPLTHPVVLWSRTLSDSPDFEQRKIAAFKLSQYSQSIYQEEVINTLLKCIKDPDEHIKVFCAKAMGRANSKSKIEPIRKALVEQYKADAQLRGTLVRTFINRKDSSAGIQETLLETIKQSTDPEELLPILDYFEQFGSTQSIDPLIALYQKSDNVKVKRGVIKALSEKGQGQDSIISVLNQCLESRDTTLILTCLSALQVQAKKDSKTLAAVEKTIESSDPDVILASLEVIQSLPESPNTKISERLIDLINGNSESDVLENAVLALGICGDYSEPVVKTLQKLIEKKELEEGLKISAALTLGKQSEKFPEGPRTALTECKTSSSSESLKTACQLALQELQTRTKRLQSAPADEKSIAEKAKNKDS